ncbi:MAG TPA: CbiQ family ECF transporter T component, partial [Candidatus Acidoferrum sp.]|nr:CbiQ family ECF transporter T component [Candidatus Acidoferrum sp.]
MHVHVIEATGRQSGPVHRFPADLKLILAIALILTVVLLPPTRALFVSVTLFLILVALLSRIPLLFLLKRLLLLEPFVLGVALLSIFQLDGWRVMLLVMLRCTLCLATTVLLAETTAPSALIAVLRKIRAPSLLVTTLLLMYRYLFVLMDETQRMRRARASRSFTTSRWPK